MLNISNNINKTVQSQQKTINRLASGMKINQAADDSAGLSISEGMRAQIRGLERAQMNAQDAVSYVQTADGVVQEVTQHIQRMRELTVQSLNDTLTDADRKQMNQEFEQLKQSISGITKNAQYNGELHAVDQHMPTYSKLEGNRIFTEPIQVIPGWNDELVIIAEPDEFKIKLPNGKFETIQDLIDQVDTQVYKDYPAIIFDVLPDNTVSVQVENHKEVTKVKGAGSFLFYEYEIGNPPGMIIGSTDFNTNDGKLEIIRGVNDHLTFYAGATKKYDFVIPSDGPNNRQSYSRDELIAVVNGFFIDKGEQDVVAKPFGQNYIAISSDKYVITGLSGNMIKVDGISSFLYDISRTGSISKSNGKYYGSAYLQQETTSVTKGVNDTLRVTLNNQDTFEISILEDNEGSGNLTGEEIVSRINAQFEALGKKAKASLSGDRLMLESDYFGATSRITVDTSSNGYDSLFKRKQITYYSPSIQKGDRTDDRLSGNYGNRSLTTIDGSNNTLSLSVNGVDHTLTIAEGEYDLEELVEQLNQSLHNSFPQIDEEVKLSFLSLSSGGRQAIQVVSEVGGTKIELNDNSLESSAFNTIFGGDRIVPPVYTSGTTSSPIPPPEGTVGGSEIHTTPAKVQGVVNIANGIELDEENRNLNFTLRDENGNSTQYTVQLEIGSYSKDSLIETLNARLASMDIPVRTQAQDDYLMLVSDAKGSGVQFSQVSGFGMEQFRVEPKGAQTATVTESVPSVTGNSALQSGPIVIDDSNNEIEFTYKSGQGEETVKITVESKTYASRADFVAAINSKLSEADLAKFKFDIDSSSKKIQLIGLEAGIGFEFKGLSGSLYEEFFKREEFIHTGYGYQGSTRREGETYILGRQPIGQEIEIFPNINQVLTFDVYENDKTTTVDVILEPKTYQRADFVVAFNAALKEGLERAGLKEDLMTAQIGIANDKPPVSYEKSDKFVLRFNEHNDGRNDSGTYQIQGVRGTAAYTYFYNSQGDPKPSYVVGITDLSAGAVIEAGLNDEFTLDIDDITKTFTIPSGNYTQETLLVELNRLLTSEKSGLIASYDNDKLKFSNREYGAIPIDGFAGSARDFLFFRTERREEQQELKFQIGANAGQSIEYNRVRLSDQLLRVNTLSIAHRNGAEKALGRLTNAISSLNEKNGYVGAIENRLDHIIRVNEVNVENLVAAESRIRDADIAKEMLEQVKQSILLQTNQAMMSHAKQFPEGVLQLLK